MPRGVKNIKEVETEVVEAVEETEAVEAAPAKEVSSEAMMHTAETRRRKLSKVYKNQELIGVSVPPLYKPYFGESMVVTINGFTVVVPCDGRTYQVAEVFATEIMSRLNKTNEIIEKGKSMANVSGNHEKSMGELKFF